MKRLVFGFFFFLFFTPAAFAANYADGLLAHENRNFDEARAIWTPVASEGDRRSQYRLGMMALSGEGQGLDVKEAIKWLELAARQKHAHAAFQLGRIYENGQGVEKDFKNAVRNYRVAADAGHATALYRLSIIHSKGLGVDKDEKEAEQFLKSAAEAGDPDAQVSHALVLSKNPADKNAVSLGYAWFTVAAENQPENDPKEKEAVLMFRSMFAGGLSSKQLISAEKLARQLQQAHPKFVPDVN